MSRGGTTCMNGRSQMQGGKNWILPKEANANRFFRESLLAINLEKPLLCLYGTEWRERGYGLRARSLRGDSITDCWSKPDLVYSKSIWSEQWAAVPLQRVANQWVSWEVIFHSNQFKTAFHTPAIMECRLCPSAQSINRNTGSPPGHGIGWQ